MAKDGFEGYKSEEFPLYGGWLTSQELIAKDAVLPIVDKYEYASGMQSLRLKSGDGGAAIMVKRFALPERFPFDTSDTNFAIANEVRIAVRSITSAESREETSRTRARDRERRQERLARRQKAVKSTSSEESTTIRSKSVQSTKSQAGTGTDSTTRTLSALTNGGSFYIYSATGVLLAEYSRYSDTVPVKDYIYLGGRLLAEYKPQESRTYFYTSDQINSTRIVTNESGTVVYSAAHDPYGGFQQTWVNTYDPMPKFSGKERDSESQLDYFGARYYDRAQYRFISVDPIYRKAIYDNQQKWNLYAYCENNPLTLFDPNGEGGRNAVKGIGADCAGSVWAIYAEAGFEYSYGNAKKGGEDSFVEEAVNTGYFKEVEKGASLQAGDVGLFNGHMVIYAGKDKDGNILVYSATEHHDFVLSVISWFTLTMGDPTWYRYEEKEPAK